MKLLFVNNFRGRGGGEEFLRDLLPGLVEKGAEVGIICRPGTPLAGMFSAGEIKVFLIPRSGLQGLTSVFKTAQVIRDGAYSLVAIQRGHDIIQSWIGAVLSRKRPALMYIAQVPEFVRSRFLLSRMDKVVTISRYIRDRIVSFYAAAASKTSIIYYGIDSRQFRASQEAGARFRKRVGLQQSDQVIGTVGDLWKNQIEFLNALVLIKKVIPHVRFVLAGSGADTTFVRDFRNRAGALGLSDALVWPG
ncbi:MAG TPA: glycosyltransferase, partial [Nitrospirota bacterium]|nr:glycosyltransferase [Nitrospirota bacterium]